MHDRLVNQLTVKQGITEQLKADIQMLWVEKMNNIANHEREMICDDVIYSYK